VEAFPDGLFGVLRGGDVIRGTGVRDWQRRHYDIIVL
jgi:hypothetical protein